MRYQVTALQTAGLSRHGFNTDDSTALFQSVPQDTEQPKQESKPLLGTEASRGAPNASGVKNATLRYDLPTPAVAVRNLVSRCRSSWIYALHCTHVDNRSALPGTFWLFFIARLAACSVMLTR